MTKVIYTVLSALFILRYMTTAQRPSFAGIRPADGLNQKDKYHGTLHTAEENKDVAIANRFSNVEEKDVVTLAYGVSQRPPIGLDIVFPSGTIIPINNKDLQFSVINRFFDDEAKLPSGNTLETTTTLNSIIPIDANGDRKYVEKLNKLPIEKQPFWFINSHAIEAHRNNTSQNVGAVQTRGSFFGG